jgi:hypothetical protein
MRLAVASCGRGHLFFSKKTNSSGGFGIIYEEKNYTILGWGLVIVKSSSAFNNGLTLCGKAATLAGPLL